MKAKVIIFIKPKYIEMESTQQSQVITITTKAAEKVAEFMKQAGNNTLYLRVLVSGGGCSGLSYGMGFEEKAEEDDSVIEQNGVKVLIDGYSQRYLKGANVDYVDSLMGSGFKINNPNVTKSCSCGHSFNTD
ncbi:MAG TPA: iron-sulfur cluster insertion protein ErpA [Nitrososphaera sp.]